MREGQKMKRILTSDRERMAMYPFYFSLRNSQLVFRVMIICTVANIICFIKECSIYNVDRHFKRNAT